MSEARRAGALMTQGGKAEERGDFESARAFFEDALALRRQAYGDDHLKVADTLDSLANALAHVGDCDAARNAQEEALTIRRKSLGPNHLLVAQSLNGLGKIAARDYQLDEARDYFKQTSEIRRIALGDAHPEVAASLNNLGNVALAIGDLSDAKTCHEQALEIWRTAFGPIHPNVASSLDSLGVLSFEDKDYVAARDRHAEALAIRLKALGDGHPDTATSYNFLGIVARRMGELETARSFHEKALAILIAANGETHLDAANCLNYLGVVMDEMGDFAAARRAHERALGIQMEALGDDHPDVATSLANLGVISDEMGDYQAARSHHERALLIQRKAFGELHPTVAGSLNNIGLVFKGMRDFPSSRAHHEKALEIQEALFEPSHLEIATSLNNLGAASHEMGDHVAARDFYERALTIQRRVLSDDHPDLCEPLVGLADFCRVQGDFRGASSFAEEGLRIGMLPGNESRLYAVYQALSQINAARGASDAAILFGKQAVNAIQRQRGRLADMEPELRRSFLATKERTYRDLAELLVAAGRLAEAQQVVGMLKEDELFDLLRRDSAIKGPTYAQLTMLEAEYQRHGDALGKDLNRLTAEVTSLQAKGDRSAEEEARLAAARVELDSAGRDFRTWLDRLSGELREKSNPDAYDAETNLRLLETTQAQLRDLGPDVALVSYILGDAKLSIILTAATLQVSRDVSISETNINRLVHEFRLALDQRLDDVVDLGQTLWRHLIEPIAALLDEFAINVLMIVPYGTLRYLPFAALHDGERHLIERFAVSVLTLAAHTSLQSKPTRKWQVAGLGVSREIEGYRRLLAVAEELAGIVRTEPKGKGIYPGVIRLDETFTEAALMAALSVHRAIHVASHFVLNPAQGLNSHLLLGDGSPLTLDRMRDVSFDFRQVELITLSACETAMGGGRQNGREFEGFAALVQLRGAKAVIASLWPVADQSTAPLMTAFYRARRSGKSKALALQTAQLSLLQGADAYAHPYHWAPFILMGNWL